MTKRMWDQNGLAARGPWKVYYTGDSSSFCGQLGASWFLYQYSGIYYSLLVRCGNIIYEASQGTKMFILDVIRKVSQFGIFSPAVSINDVRSIPNPPICHA